MNLGGVAELDDGLLPSVDGIAPKEKGEHTREELAAMILDEFLRPFARRGFLIAFWLLRLRRHPCC
jgi:hypothetical protein